LSLKHECDQTPVEHEAPTEVFGARTYAKRLDARWKKWLTPEKPSWECEYGRIERNYALEKVEERVIGQECGEYRE